METDSATLESAACTIFEIFVNAEVVTPKQIVTLEKLFGSVQTSLITEAHQIVQSVVKLIPDKCGIYNKFAFLLPIWFGNDIQFTSGDQNFDAEFLDCLIFNEDSINLENSDYNWHSVNASENVTKYSENVIANKNVVTGSEWLEKHLKKHFGNIAVEDIVSSIKALLISSKSNEELQNEVGIIFGLYCCTLIKFYEIVKDDKCSILIKFVLGLY